MTDPHRHPTRHRYALRLPSTAVHTRHAAHDPSDACCRSCAVARRSTPPSPHSPPLLDDRDNLDGAAFRTIPFGRWLMIAAPMGGMGLAALWAICWAMRAAGGWASLPW